MKISHKQRPIGLSFFNVPSCKFKVILPTDFFRSHKKSVSYKLHTDCLLLIPVILLTFFFSSSFANAKNKYIEQMDSDTSINWAEGICEDDFLLDKNSKHKIGYLCKIENDNTNSIYATWLKDSKGKLLHVPNFLPVKILSTDSGYGLELYSDANALSLFLEIDKNGVFQESHVVDGEILLNDEQSGLRYPGSLVWRSPL